MPAFPRHPHWCVLAPHCSGCSVSRSLWHVVGYGRTCCMLGCNCTTVLLCTVKTELLKLSYATKSRSCQCCTWLRHTARALVSVQAHWKQDPKCPVQIAALGLGSLAVQSVGAITAGTHDPGCSFTPGMTASTKGFVCVGRQACLPLRAPSTWAVRSPAGDAPCNLPQDYETRRKTSQYR